MMTLNPGQCSAGWEAQINADLCVEVLLWYREGAGIHPVEDP